MFAHKSAEMIIEGQLLLLETVVAGYLHMERGAHLNELKWIEN